ncbi:MAG: hypothetical protein P8Y99_10345 [Calditrichaceae bacterium]
MINITGFPVRRGKRRRPISHVSKVERNVNLRLKNSIVKDVIITGIAGDSIITEKTTKIGKEIHKTHKNYAIDDIEDVSIIRTIDASKTFAIGVMPGLGAGLHTFIITRDDGLFDDYSREEKAGKILLIGEIIGISVSSSLIAMRNADYDYVLTGLSSEQKSENIGQFITRGLRRKTNPRFSPWVGVYYFRNYLNNSITFPGIRLSLCFTPRSRMEIMYGYSEGWSLENKKFEIQQRGETKKFTNFYILKIGFRVDQSYHKNLNAFIAWGWGVLWKRFEYSYEYYNQSYQKDIQLNTDIIINLDIGLEHHFNTWLSAEARIGIVENFDYGLHPMVQVGLHLGRFY